jgi:hypothetical protein
MENYGIFHTARVFIINVTLEGMNPDADNPGASTSRHIPEVINPRGQIHPIMDINVEFGMERDRIADETRIIVINKKKTKEGIAERQYPDPRQHKFKTDGSNRKGAEHV